MITCLLSFNPATGCSPVRRIRLPATMARNRSISESAIIHYVIPIQPLLDSLPRHMIIPMQDRNPSRCEIAIRIPRKYGKIDAGIETPIPSMTNSPPPIMEFTLLHVPENVPTLSNWF